jgi:diguanylate cyclase (GGDEF)-like protein
MLDSVSNGLQEAENMQDIQILRKCLLEDVSSLSQTHHALIDRLSETKSYLRMIETDSRKLSDELARVRMLSMTDELTELPNRRAFMRRLEDEVGRTKRYGFRLALVMLDLDNFKTINDRYGHAGGDSVLRTYANDILTVFRQHDMVARYGGEEFAVLLPNTDEHGAQAALNKVRRVVAETRCVHDDDIIETPTFSAGLTMYVNGDTPATLIQRADDALYTAKRLGRNRVEVKYGIALENKPVKIKPVVNKGNNS